MEKFLQEVGARVKEARMRKHLSQAQLADLLGLTPPYISNIETGKQNMSITALAKISDVLEPTGFFGTTRQTLWLSQRMSFMNCLRTAPPQSAWASCGWRVKRRKRFVTATESNKVTGLLQYRTLSYHQGAGSPADSLYRGRSRSQYRCGSPHAICGQAGHSRTGM